MRVAHRIGSDKLQGDGYGDNTLLNILMVRDPLGIDFERDGRESSKDSRSNAMKWYMSVNRTRGSIRQDNIPGSLTAVLRHLEELHTLRDPYIV